MIPSVRECKAAFLFLERVEQPLCLEAALLQERLDLVVNRLRCRFLAALARLKSGHDLVLKLAQGGVGFFLLDQHPLVSGPNKAKLYRFPGHLVLPKRNMEVC